MPAPLDFSYDALAGRVVFGAGSRRGVGGELDRLGASRALLIAGRAESAPVAELIGALGSRVVGRFDDIAQHVPVDRAEQARRQARDLDADCTITVGGGSATGFGKAIALTERLPQIAIPTTYAGSEMTPIWGLTTGARKLTGNDPAVQPRVVIYDPELTLTLPPRVAGPSGMNALAHAVEALYAPGANPVISLLALEAARVLCGALPRVVAAPADLEARTEAFYGTYLAACALAVSGTALHHKTCHVLGGLFNLDHGGMNAVVLPHALAYNGPAMSGVYGRLGAVLGGDPAEVVFDLARTIDAPASLAALGMPEEGIDRAVAAIVDEASANIRRPDADSIRELLLDAYHGRRPRADRRGG